MHGVQGAVWDAQMQYGRCNLCGYDVQGCIWCADMVIECMGAACIRIGCRVSGFTACTEHAWGCRGALEHMVWGAQVTACTGMVVGMVRGWSGGGIGVGWMVTK